MASNTEIMKKLDSMDVKLDDHGQRLANLEGQHEAEDKIKRGSRDWASVTIAGVALVVAFAKTIFNSIT